MSDAAEEVKVELNTTVAVYQWLKEVCSTKLLSTPIKFGGPGVVVRIDESLMHHRSKACMNMVHSRNIDGLMRILFPPAKRCRCLGYMAHTSSTPVLGYMEVAPCSDARTLLLILQAHMLLGTVILVTSGVLRAEYNLYQMYWHTPLSITQFNL